MCRVFLSYAIEDGSEAAARLRFDLTRAGHSVWQDIAEMRGGHPWKEQLRAALREVDAVLVLLTPKAVESKYVTWEWENALTLRKRVIPLMVRPCSPPPELSHLHYYRLEQPDRYVSEFSALLRDLYELPTRPTSPAPEPGAAGSTFTVGTAINSAVGNNPVVINQASPAPEPEQKRTPTAGATQKKPSRPK